MCCRRFEQSQQDDNRECLLWQGSSFILANLFAIGGESMFLRFSSDTSWIVMVGLWPLSDSRQTIQFENDKSGVDGPTVCNLLPCWILLACIHETISCDIVLRFKVDLLSDIFKAEFVTRDCQVGSH